jgi:hypothetical protein
MKKPSNVVQLNISYTGIFLFLLLFCVSSLFAQDVDKTELASTRDTAVEFINYEGPHSKIETLEQIMGVGKFLGNSIGEAYSTATYAGKYRVIHAAGEGSDDGLEADIFILLEDAEVDHIRNMRYMIAGFLISAYEYTEEDALLLGEFVTIYNAVYRGKMDFLSSKYKQVVTRNLRSGAAGISTIYTEWPGNTEMVIPLTVGASEGGLGSLDTDVLTDEKVIEEMRTQGDRGLESRKEITELKEREVEQEQEKIEEERGVIDDERDRLAAEQERIQKERGRVADERARAESDAEKAKADEKEAALESEEEKLETAEDTLSDREEELSAREDEQAERIDQIQNEREDIATDERELMEQDAEEEATQIASAAGSRGSSSVLLFLEIRELGGESLGRLVQIDTSNGAITNASSVNSIRNRGVESLGSEYVVVAGTTSGQGAVRLMTLDKDSLETGREGSDDMYQGSGLLVDGASVYAITNPEGVWKIGKFDNTLALRELSDIEVFQDTVITLAESMIYVVGIDGAIHTLSAQDLADTGTIR